MSEMEENDMGIEERWKRRLAERAKRFEGYTLRVKDGPFAGVYRDAAHLKETWKPYEDAYVAEHGCDWGFEVPWLWGTHPDDDKPDLFMSSMSTHCFCDNRAFHEMVDSQGEHDVLDV